VIKKLREGLLRAAESVEGLSEEAKRLRVALRRHEVEWDRALLAAERERHLLRALVAQCRTVLTCVRRPSRGSGEAPRRHALKEGLAATPPLCDKTILLQVIAEIKALRDLPDDAMSWFQLDGEVIQIQCFRLLEIIQLMNEK
jgi:hypothetical protein